MTKERKELISTIFLMTIGTAAAILSAGSRPPNIADNPAFGCRWQGGSSATLTCTCQSDSEEFYIQENSIDAIDLNTISINGCNAVKFGPKSIQNMRSLRLIHLSNIEALTLEESSFHWEGYVANGDRQTPSLRITIENTRVPQISSHAFRGRIREIVFADSTVEHVAPFSFSSLTQNQNIEFRNATLRDVQPQAFKKFATEYLTIADSNVDQLPSRAFSELTVAENFIVANSTFGRVKSGAFTVHGVRRFEVTNSDIEVLEGEAFKVTTRGDFVFKNVVFGDLQPGAFAGVNVDFREVPSRKIAIFDGLSVNGFEPRTFAVNATSFETKITDVLINEECSCDRRDIGDAYRLEEFGCLWEGARANYGEFVDERCSLLSSNATLIIVCCVVLILVIVIGSVLVVYFKKVLRGDRYGNEKKDKSGKMSMIVPDGRTYRETELHVIVERADLLTTDL